MRRVRLLTDDGQRILNVFVDILEGRIKGTARDRIEAGRILLERGHGKVPETVLAGAMPDETRDALVELSREQLLALASAAPPVIDAVPERKALPDAPEVPQATDTKDEDA